jgi:hypothetical protein
MVSQGKIIFLFLHGTHHLFHIATTAMELSRLQDEYKVILLSCTEDHTKILKKIQQIYPENRCEIINTKTPFRFKYLNYKKKSYPSPYDTIPRSVELLKDADFVITTSHSTPELFRKFRIKKPKILYQYHGCGDRRYGFDPELRRFDFMLLPGDYHLRRLLSENIIEREKTEIVGWPKLDYQVNIQELRGQLFPNHNPIVLYSPHWEEKLSSYKKWGEDIIKYFFNQQDLNLIFAPHVQIKHWKNKYGYNINFDAYNCDTVHIDFDSVKSVDLSYLHIADLYLGDVSSIVYEWIAIKPRPCVFLNANTIQWRDNVDYRFWDFGPVVENIHELAVKLNKSFKDDSFLHIQKERITEYMDITDIPSSQRAALAIKNFINKSN